MPKVFLETPRLILRQWIASDYKPYAQLNADKEVMEFFPAILSNDESAAQIERLKSHIDEHGFGFFATERKDNKQFIGFTGLSHPKFESWFTPCVEIGWRLSKANWGRGYATEAANACLAFGFDVLGLDEIYSFTSVHNVRSEQVMKKIGMAKLDLFDHPDIEEGNILQQHLLYKSANSVRN